MQHIAHETNEINLKGVIMSAFLIAYRQELLGVRANIVRLKKELAAAYEKESHLVEGIAKREAYELSKREVSFISMSEWLDGSVEMHKAFKWSKHTKSSLSGGLGGEARKLGKVGKDFKKNQTVGRSKMTTFDPAWLDLVFAPFIIKERTTILTQYRRTQILIDAPRRPEIAMLEMIEHGEAFRRVGEAHQSFLSLSPKKERGAFLRCMSKKGTDRVSSYKKGEGTLYSVALVNYVIENFDLAKAKYNSFGHHLGFRKL